MKREYVFVILIAIMFYMIYLTISYKYNEYVINTKIERLYENNEKIWERIKSRKEEIEYKSSKSYKNKMLKEEQWYKNKWEKVVYLISEEKINELKDISESIEETVVLTEFEQTINSMTIFQKWVFFLFNKDTR